jgi:hypothetical protein
MENKLKKGDLLTVQTESIASDYGRTRDFDSLIIESKESIGGFADLEELSKKSIYRVVRGPIHEDLAKYGVKIDCFSVEGEKVKSLVFVTEGEVRVNGEHDIPYKAVVGRKLSEAHFLDENTAQAVATRLNKEEREHLKILKDSIGKALVMMDQIVDKKMI